MRSEPDEAWTTAFGAKETGKRQKGGKLLGASKS